MNGNLVLIFARGNGRGGKCLTPDGLYVDTDAPMGDVENVDEHLPGMVAGRVKKG